MSRLKTGFCINKTETDGATEFFSKIKEFDAHIGYAPMKEFVLLSPGENFFDADTNTITYKSRGDATKKIAKISLEEINVNSGNLLNDFTEEIKRVKDSMLIVGKDKFFVNEESMKCLAHLCKLSGSALNKQSAARDNYIAELMAERSAECAIKRKAVIPFTFIYIEDCGIKRVVAVRSGNYKDIPQTVLQDIFEDFISSDDFGTFECVDWHINHHLSYVDFDCPDIANQIKEDYSELIGAGFDFVPGIRLSIGSTGYQSLKISMIWRKPTSIYPVIMDEYSVSQKHCETYDINIVTERVKKNIFARYGRLPERLAELYVQELPKTEGILQSTAESIVKQLNLAKILLQKEGVSPSEKADYRKKIVDLVVTEVATKAKPTAYDMAMAFMSLSDKLTIPDSYKTAVRNALFQAPFCEF